MSTFATFVMLVTVVVVFLVVISKNKRSTSMPALRVRYQQAKEFTENLRAAERTYADDPGQLPIIKSDYLALLTAFEKLLTWVDAVPEAYDTDFRRNLPGSSLDGSLVPPDIAGRIGQARRFLQNHDATAVMGHCILQNINGCLNLVRHDAPAGETLKSIAQVVARIASGDIRPSSARAHPGREIT